MNTEQMTDLAQENFKVLMENKNKRQCDLCLEYFDRKNLVKCSGEEESGEYYLCCKECF